MAEISKTPTKEYLEHLKKSEGTLNVVYKDSLGLATGGTGHLMTDADKKFYGIDDSTIYKEIMTKYGTRKVATDKDGNIIKLKEKVTDAWLEKDSAKYYKTGQSWAKELGIEDQAMVNALSEVSFQFPAFKDKMPSAWEAIKVGDMEEAINQIKFVSGKPGTTISDWYFQTADRVEDLSAALRKYSLKKDIMSIKPDDAVIDTVGQIPN
jgi:GH24 family phage-related lysozyme (muramidase)